MFYSLSLISLTRWFHENTLTLWLYPWCNHFIQHIFHMIKSLVLISNHCFETMLKLLLVQMFGRLTIDFIDCLNDMVFNICNSDFELLYVPLVVHREITVLHGLS
jgi:hypothetical protein